jgi:hypothetical protein
VTQTLHFDTNICDASSLFFFELVRHEKPRMVEAQQDQRSSGGRDVESVSGHFNTVRPVAPERCGDLNTGVKEFTAISLTFIVSGVCYPWIVR